MQKTDMDHAKPKTSEQLETVQEVTEEEPRVSPTIKAKEQNSGESNNSQELKSSADISIVVKEPRGSNNVKTSITSENSVIIKS